MKASRWFKTTEDLLQTCSDAVSLARGENNEEFAQRTMKKAKQYGIDIFMSEAQMIYLCKLADRVPPLPLEDDNAER